MCELVRVCERENRKCGSFGFYLSDNQYGHIETTLQIHKATHGRVGGGVGVKN